MNQIFLAFLTGLMTGGLSCFAVQGGLLAGILAEQKKEEQKTFTAEEFAKSYGELCEKTGWRVVVAPVWIARDDATFSMQLQYQVGKLPKKEEAV